MKTAHFATLSVLSRLISSGIPASYEQAHCLRRAELTLHRWSERECGDSNDYASFSVERDEATNKPYLCTYRHDSDKVRRHAIPDLEAGALKRVKAISAELGVNFFHQTDPRGCALYVSQEPINDSNYSRGVACCV